MYVKKTFVVVLAISIIALTIYGASAQAPEDAAPNFVTAKEIVLGTSDPNRVDLFHNDTALYNHVKTYGPTLTVRKLYQLFPTYGNCHQAAHKTGHFSYEIYGAESFGLCTSECHSGCYHGAMEAYFRDHGTADLKESINTLC